MRDIYNTKHRYSLAVKKLNRSIIHDSDKKAIKEYVNYRVAGGLGIHRAIKYMGTLRLLAEHLPCTFDNAILEDITDLVAWVHLDKDTDSTKHGYLTILRKFYKYKEKPELVDWYDIKKPRPVNPTVITEYEVLLMIQVANNLRDQAIVSGLYESSTRVGEYFASLKISSVHFDSMGAHLSVDGKTGPRRVRIVFAAPYIKNWLHVHPFKEDSNEYLWLGTGHRSHNKPLQYDAIIRVVQRLAKKAGITKHISLKTFRHSRATFLANYLTSFQLDEFQGWVQGSNMPATYIHAAGASLDKSVLHMYGLVPESPKPILVPRFCPDCRTLNAPTYGFCMECGIYIGPILSENIIMTDGGHQDKIYRTLQAATEK